MPKAGRHLSLEKPSRLANADESPFRQGVLEIAGVMDSTSTWQRQHIAVQSEQLCDADSDLLPERCTSPVAQSPMLLHCPSALNSRHGCTFNGQICASRQFGAQLAADQCSSSYGSTTSSQQQQIMNEAMAMLPGVYTMQHQHQHQTSTADVCSSPNSSCLQEDGALMDFWVLLQQTQQNLQDMLVDLETAKIELELAKGRADEAEHACNALRVQLSASQQRNTALEQQLQHAQDKEAAAAAHAATLIQRNTELATESHQAHQAAASMELKLERLQGQLAAAQRNIAAAGAPAAQQAAAAAAVASQLKAELSQTKNELAAAQSRAARAELELAVVKTKVLVAHQQATAAADRCKKLERQVTSLNSQLGAATAESTVAAEEKRRLQADLEALQMRLEMKDSRLRSSMNALARASSSLRASYSAQGGAVDPALRVSQSSASQIAADLRSSAQMTAGLLQKVQDLKANQQLQQQAAPRYKEPSILELAGNTTNRAANASRQPEQTQQGVLPAATGGSGSGRDRPTSPFASFAGSHQQQQQVEHHPAGRAQHATSSERHWTSSTGSESCRSSSGGSSSSHSTSHGVAAVDRQSPIFKQRKALSATGSRNHSQAGTLSGGSGSTPLSCRSSSRGSPPLAPAAASPAAAVAVAARSVVAAAAAAAAMGGSATALPPRPPRSSNSNSTTPRSPRVSNPGLSPRLSSMQGSSSDLLRSASSSTPLFASPCASRRTSSSGLCEHGGGINDEEASPEDVGGNNDAIAVSVGVATVAESETQSSCDLSHDGKPAAGVVDKRAMQFTDKDKAAFTASTEAPWLKASTKPDGTAAAVTGNGSIDASATDHWDVGSASAALTDAAEAEASELPLVRPRPLSRGVSDCSMTDGTSSRQLSTGGVSSLVAASGMGVVAEASSAESAQQSYNADSWIGSSSNVLSSSTDVSSLCSEPNKEREDGVSSSVLLQGTECSSTTSTPRQVVLALLPAGAAALVAVFGTLGLLHQQRNAGKAKMQTQMNTHSKKAPERQSA